MKINILGGVLAITGITHNAVVCQITGLETYGDSIAHLINQFGKNCIESRTPETGDSLIIFEYNLRQTLRNPRKLLKSLRHKTMLAVNKLEVELRKSDEAWADWERKVGMAGQEDPYSI